ncbi:unnamed protein product [Cuscuta campestris]|uniref:F-box associated beta-propeller type 3 domain-containing protein n=1 Tax=Cuscuta campestris TaxID=132261 RepID=A0A484KYM3_9ASTE|nr:unnamed protein product [Cuscuta campestris]
MASKNKGRRIVPCSCTRKKRKLNTPFPSDLIFSILLCLPADIIYGVMQYVSREWYNIVRSPSFVYSHLKKSTHGFLLQVPYNEPISFLAMGKKGDEVELREVEFPCFGDFESSCNGLLVMVHPVWIEQFYVANPVLNQQIALPPCPSIDGIRSCTLVYAASSGVYKVVYGSGTEAEYVLTVGETAWRPLQTSQLTAKLVYLLQYRPLSLGGFLYWASNSDQFVVILNVETETFHQIPLPQGCTNRWSIQMFSMGSSPCLMWQKEEYVWALWLLTDQETGTWAKMPDVNLLGHCLAIQVWHRGLQSRFTPIGWLKESELIVFRISSCDPRIVVYNVRLEKIHCTFPVIPRRNASLFWAPHVNSLVSLRNLYAT